MFVDKYVIVFRYLLDHGASVSAVNNDGELAIDISESDEMEELLQKEIDNQVTSSIELCFEKLKVYYMMQIKSRNLHFYDIQIYLFYH